MDGLNLTAEQCGQMLWREEMHRQRLERIYQRMIDRNFPESDPLRVGVRRALLATRELCLLWADGLGKSEHCHYNKRARCWPRV